MTPINNNLPFSQKPYQPVEKKPIKIPYPLPNFCTPAPLSLSTNSSNTQQIPPALALPFPFPLMTNPYVEKKPLKIPYPFPNFSTPAPLSLSTNSSNIQQRPLAPPQPPPVLFPWMTNPFTGDLDTFQIQLKTQQLYNQMQAQSRLHTGEEKKLQSPDLLCKSIQTPLNTPVCKTEPSKETQAETLKETQQSAVDVLMQSQQISTSNEDNTKVYISLDRYNRSKKIQILGQEYLDLLQMLARYYPTIPDELLPPNITKDCPKRVCDRIFSQWRISIHRAHEKFLNEKRSSSHSQTDLLYARKNQEFITEFRYALQTPLDAVDSENTITISESENRLFSRWRQIVIAFLSKEFQEIINTTLNIENLDTALTLDINFTDASIESGILNTAPSTPCLTSAKVSLSDFGLS